MEDSDDQSEETQFLLALPDYKRRASTGKWSPEEDESLRRAVNANSGKNWKKIAFHLPGRTDVQCLHRWQKVLKPGLVKGPWTPEEDTLVAALVNKYGQKKVRFCEYQTNPSFSITYPCYTSRTHLFFLSKHSGALSQGNFKGVSANNVERDGTIISVLTSRREDGLNAKTS
jgi:hypothetical protein